LSLHDILDCPPSLRFGEVAVLVLDEGDDTHLRFTFGAPVSALAEPRSTT